MGARSRLKCDLWEQGASKVAAVYQGAIESTNIKLLFGGQNCFLILVIERIREQIGYFQGSRENEKLQRSKREKMQGAQEKIRREQGEWTKIRGEQGAKTPPLRVSLMD